MDASWISRDQVVEKVVACTGQAEDGVTVTDLEKALINSRIFPGKRIEVILVELRVFPQVLFIVDACLAVLVEGTG